MSVNFSPLTHAELDWNEQGLPVSRAYGDVYFSADGGLEETRHIFLAGNHLEKRLAESPVFTVGETGFGSGLNFLALWQLWEKVAPPDARLHFFSAEKHPLRVEDMARIHALFPEIEPYGKELREALPPLVPGFHRLHLACGRIFLTLLYGDAREMLAEQDCAANAWFLDGFAPRLNPDLWAGDLAKEIQRLSAPGATLATFSTATSTLQALGDSGFTLEKKPGFGRKKNMLTGSLPGLRATVTMPTSITIAGAGLAGAATARALALRGIVVEVREKENHIAAGSSANPSSILFPKPSVGWQPATAFYFAAYGFTRHLLQQVRGVPHDLCGMLLFPKPGEELDRQARIMASMLPEASLFRTADTAEASDIAGIPVPAALHFPGSGWVDMGAFTRALLAHPLITVKTGAAYEGDEPVIFCNAHHAAKSYPALAGFLHTIRGQISCVASRPPLSALNTVLSYGGYLTPAINGLHHLGATYDRSRTDSIVDAESHDANLAKLATFLPQADLPAPEYGWAALRCFSRDRMPVIGLSSKNDSILGFNIAHGSRGLLTCTVGGEHMASLLQKEPLPLPRSLQRLVLPTRGL